MKVTFRDISGHSFLLVLPEDCLVSQACNYISQKFEIKENQIFLVSPNENSNFYQSCDKMTDVLKENMEYVIFQKIPISDDKNQVDNKKRACIQKDNKNLGYNQFFIRNNYYFSFVYQNKYPNLKKLLPGSIYRTLNSAKMNRLYHPIYQEYSLILKKIPADFQDKVNQIAELGFPIEDIKEYLRSSEFNVQIAINKMIHQRNNQNGNQNNNIYTFSNQNIWGWNNIGQSRISNHNYFQSYSPFGQNLHFGSFTSGSHTNSE
ncbi:hypothetical protein M9Y10_026657 [Tritrichomonas musculus]|uniref:UBA domain-containing protein n=1 Tax=Tritrichomonas musculus TaxID=1915356 RepID=A0ABR2H7B3_9EUKA